jgi:iron complex outermembrane receptor protein
MSAKMLANMMSGDTNPLKSSNVDAELYGIDLNGYYHLSDQIELSTIISYV